MALRKSLLRVAGVLSLAIGAAVAVQSDAQAGWHKRHIRHHGHYHVAAAPYSPAFAALVVDANSGRTLYSANEDAPRHPASLTKVMTLYMLFEQLEKGNLTLESRIAISEHAAAQEPSKLGIQPGDTISVEDAIKAVVTRSANDVAVAIAEAIGHDESAFAEMMTRKAHALGMSRTVYRNASGLPNDEQITTAHDLALLARATEDRFPRYFHYFSTHEFEYGGEIIGNHNHLLGRVEGVDGIKTGYTRASGFNLLTSVHRDGRSLVAVVMGGKSSGARDRIMESLISDHIAQAAYHHTATMVAEAAPVESAAKPVAAAEAKPVRAEPVALASAARGRNVQARVEEGDSTDEGDEPTLRVAAVAPPPKTQRQAAPIKVAALAPVAPHVDLSDPVALGWTKGPDAAPAPKPENAKLAAVPVNSGKVMMSDGSYAPASAAKPAAAKEDMKPAAKVQEAKAPTAGKDRNETTIAIAKPRKDAAVARAEETEPAPRGGWVIQIGATDDQEKANALLIRARASTRATLAMAKPVTEKVKKGEDTFYRARFAGLDSASAESACRSLKRAGFACFAAHD